MWFWVVEVRFVRITAEGDSLVKRCFGLIQVYATTEVAGHCGAYWRQKAARLFFSTLSSDL
jgi:hypothetical protein